MHTEEWKLFKRHPKMKIIVFMRMRDIIDNERRGPTAYEKDAVYSVVYPLVARVP